MKKLFVSVALAMMSVAAFAQNAVGQITIQPKIGMNIASLTDADGADSRIGLAVGAEAEFGVTDIVGLSIGAMYSMQGVKDSEDGVGATMKLDYINVPILANVYVAPGLAVKLGLQPGFKVNSKVEAKVNGVKAEADLEGVKSIDLSIPVGLSYQYQNFVLDARYNWGVTKAFNDDYGTSAKNSVFQITLGYKFSL